MLILTRRPGESLTIGDDIRLTVLSVSAGDSGSVVLGIDAPRDVLILRSELQQAISANRDSAQTALASPQAVAALEQALHRAASHAEPKNNTDEEGKEGVLQWK